MKNLTTDQIATLTPDQVAVLTTDQISGLTLKQLFAFITIPVAGLTHRQLNRSAHAAIRAHARAHAIRR